MHLQSQGSAEALIGARHVPTLPLDSVPRMGSSPLGSGALPARSQTARQPPAKASRCRSA